MVALSVCTLNSEGPKKVMMSWKKDHSSEVNNLRENPLHSVLVLVIFRRSTYLDDSSKFIKKIIACRKSIIFPYAEHF